MQYPDIRENSVHPYRHYLEFGWIENRKPNSRVCEETVMTQQYLKQRSYVELELEKKFLRRPRFGKENPLFSKNKQQWLNSNTKNRALRSLVKNLQKNIHLGETSRSAYENYLRIASITLNALKPETILKTDCHNETNRFKTNIPLIPFLCQATKNVECLEISPEVVAEARNFNQIPENCRITVGSITESHFDAKSMDLIFDFSTIDHLQESEVSRALKEYSNICKKNGVVVMCVWTAEKYLYIESEIQSYFSKQELEKKLVEYFSILFIKDILIIEDKTLILYVLEPKES
jgi:SAM-dependent methyltransferase